MKKTVSLVRTKDPMDSISKALVPPPSKNDIIRATAQALWQKRNDECEVAAKKWRDDEAELKRDILAHVRANPTAANDPWFYGGQDLGTVQVGFRLSTELRKRIKALPNSPPPPPHIDHIYDELIKRSRENRPTVDALLSDPDMRAKLVKLGEGLLKAVTPSERSSYIPV